MTALARKKLMVAGFTRVPTDDTQVAYWSGPTGRVLRCHVDGGVYLLSQDGETSTRFATLTAAITFAR